jgi:hypothetical protein
MTKSTQYGSILACWLILLVLPPRPCGSTDRPIEQPVRRAITTRQTTQKAEERWRSQKEAMIARYRQLQGESARLEDEKKSHLQQIRASRERLEAKTKQMEDIGQISKQIEPFLAGLVSEMQDRIDEGLPFLGTERHGRIEKMERLVADPDIAASEKYRKVMEALLVEAEYGLTAEVYQEDITVDGHSELANILRLGRISLFFLSLDGSRCGFYDVAAGAWRPLPKSHNRNIRTAADIAAKRRPAELLSLPLGRMVSP